jgi:hypothetical protein
MPRPDEWAGGDAADSADEINRTTILRQDLVPLELRSGGVVPAQRLLSA